MNARVSSFAISIDGYGRRQTKASKTHGKACGVAIRSPGRFASHSNEYAA